MMSTFQLLVNSLSFVPFLRHASRLLQEGFKARHLIFFVMRIFGDLFLWVEFFRFKCLEIIRLVLLSHQAFLCDDRVSQLAHPEYIQHVPIPQWTGQISQFTCLGSIRPCAFIIANLFCYRLGSINSCVSSIFNLVPLSYWIYFDADQVFSTYVSQVHLALLLCHSRFILTPIEFSRLMHLECIQTIAYLFQCR